MANVAPPSEDTHAGAHLLEDGAVCPPVVGIGASAGGLEAMKELLAATPDDTGACFVFVQHLDPDHKSMQAELLGRCTSMAVLDAEDGMAAEANRLVIIPPNATLTISGGVLRLARPAPPRTHRTPIDTFFRSLATDQGERAIAIVLSGTGSDGTHGLKAVKPNFRTLRPAGGGKARKSWLFGARFGFVVLNVVSLAGFSGQLA